MNVIKWFKTILKVPKWFTKFCGTKDGFYENLTNYCEIFYIISVQSSAETMKTL